MTRALRRHIAKLGIATLLFMQFAVAAYACPNMLGSAASGMAMGEMSEAMPMGDCGMADQAAPNLCAQHCQYDSQAAGHVSPVVFTVDLPLLAVLPVVEISPAAAAPFVSREFLAHATSPPTSIRFGVFRS